MKIRWKLKTYNEYTWEISTNASGYVLVNSIHLNINKNDLNNAYQYTVLKTFIRRLYKLERL